MEVREMHSPDDMKKTNSANNADRQNKNLVNSPKNTVKNTVKNNKSDIPCVTSDTVICFEKIEAINNDHLYRIVKRGFDFVASTIALIVCALPMLLIALIIKIESPGPAIFKQERLGKNGVPFVMYKFRSMCLDAEKNGPRWASVYDDRCTKFGRFIRLCHADELPQLWNVIKGEMSLVGPRPERPYYYEKFDEYLPQFKERLRVMPGLTGLSQVNGCYDLLPEERLAYDIEYMENRSYWLDLKCMLKTVLVIFNGKGAR